MIKIDLNSWHPYPRYGVAASIVENNAYSTKLENVEAEQLTQLALLTLKENLNGYLLRTTGDPKTDPVLLYSVVYAEDLNPGSKNGQSKNTGYFLAPHVLTGSNFNLAYDKVINLIKLLNNTNPLKSSRYELTKAFAPMITKINAGTASMSNPRVSLLEAAFTAVATLTQLKPCAYAYVPSKDTFSNFGIIPDLPIYHGDSQPLVDFIQIFKSLSQTYEGKDRYIAKVDSKEKDFVRPKLYNGNYPGSSGFGSIGAVSLLAAIGRWKREIEPLAGFEEATWIQNILKFVKKRSFYIVSFEDTRQEYFGHHLVDLAFDQDLSEINWAANEIEPLGIDKSGRFDHPTWKPLKRAFDSLLRFYTSESLRDFLFFRAEYPAELETFFRHFIKQNFKMENQTLPISDEIVESAKVYGYSLNRAAFIAAMEETEKVKGILSEKDKKRKIRELKHRKLMQLESMIMANQEDEPILDLLSRLGRMVARETLFDIDAAADVFVEAAIKNRISPKDTKSLILIFMRLQSKSAKKKAPDSVLDYEEEGLEQESTQTEQ